ncbi:MAG: multidrug transporter [Solobacterium sp.]|nr:multidrug transporter [Solobacterium sp.]
MSQFPEQDWKLLRKKLPEWQEAAMEQLCREYIGLLQKNEPASERFWTLEQRIREDRKRTGVVADMRRSNAELILLNLLSEQAITEADLADFSEDTRDRVLTLLQFRNME